MRRPHLVPLSRQLVVMLRDLHQVTGRNPFLFPGRGNYGTRDGSVISERTIGNVFNKLGYKDRMTPHSSRHTASTVLNEHGWNPRWIDAQLSHKETTGPKVRGEYNHAVYLEHRREMMQWYADHLSGVGARYGNCGLSPVRLNIHPQRGDIPTSRARIHAQHNQRSPHATLSSACNAIRTTSVADKSIHRLQMF